MARRRRREQTNAEVEDLGVDWERWADGRAFRLKRKRDFPDVDPGKARDAAELAAERMGKVVLTTRDKRLAKKYVWVQFADARIKLGDPCPCGSRRLLRLHRQFARCPECNSFLMLSKLGEAEEKTPRAERTLRELSDVHLARRGRDGDVDLYRGYGRREEERVFLLAQFTGEPEQEPVTPEDAFDRVTSVQVVPFEQLEEFADLSPLEHATGWDLRL
jgi:hypothetical protein